MDNNNELEEKKSTAGAWVMLVLAVLYGFSPVDIIPDIPVIGWIDDFFINATAILNLIQAECHQTNETLASIAKGLKWLAIGRGVVVILLVLLLGSFIVSLFN